MMPEEDRNLCKHRWVDMYNGSGLLQHDYERMMIFFYCRNCLDIRKKIIDMSGQFVHPDTIELYEDNGGRL